MIECINLTKSYNSTKALDSIDFKIEENKITGLIGRNGAGKTTLLKLIAGYTKATSGEVYINGKNPFNNFEISKNLIFIDDKLLFGNSLTLIEILKTAKSFYPKWDEKLATGLVEHFSLPINKRYIHLSKGMISTFNSIVGICSRCSITLFDEPTTGMDSAVRKDFYRAVLKDYINFPRTIIISSHLLGEIEELLEDILLLQKGRVNLHLPVLELKEYAIGIKGSTDKVLKTGTERNLIYKEEFSTGNIYSVYKNDFSKEEIDAARLDGLEVTNVSSDQLCIYLTMENKGGIDDVFKDR